MTTAALLGLIFSTGCAARQAYTPPAVSAPAAFKEDANWKVAQPRDQNVRGEWWEIFNDPQLNSLEEQIEVNNETLKAAQARFEQARSGIRYSRGGLYPSVNAASSILNVRQSENRARTTSRTYYSDLTMPVDVSYEADVWGRVRQTIQASHAETQASAADVETVRLSLHAELAANYFQLRALDAEKQLLESTVASYEKALELTQNRFRGGVASDADVAQAETQLATTQAQAIDVTVERQQREHAIAVLLGKSASQFELPSSPLTAQPPTAPVGVPSELLERRPDIAAAERRVAAANERVGIAHRAFFPTLTLSAAQGFQGRSFANWFLAPSAFWSAGPSAVLALFDAGRRRSVSEQTQAFYTESIASYRQAVLNAFQEVEDSLATLRILDQEAETQQAAVKAAERSLALSNNRYKGGVASYLEVITAQNAALLAQRAAVDILRRRTIASVLLIKALGGGWNVSSLPAVP